MKKEEAKAKAYDLIATIQSLQAKLTELNNFIATSNKEEKDKK